MAQRPLVDFVVIGAMKAMTTSLLGTLAEHPEIAVSSVKETQYFVAETGHPRGQDWYRSLFAHAAPDQLRGEASPQYTFFPVYAGVPARIATEAPDAKLVYLVRDPVDRALSQYRHAVDLAGERRPLQQAVLNDARYQNPSRYWLQLTQFFRSFPEERVLVVDADRMAADPAAVLAQVCRHVGARSEEAPTGLARLNAADQREAGAARTRRLGVRPRPTAPEPSEDERQVVRERLQEVFAADISELARHMGAEAPAWAREAR